MPTKLPSEAPAGKPAQATAAEAADLTIQEMARQSGLSEHTLRFYERIGLLTPIPRDSGSGHRRYPPDTVQMVESLACLRGTGMTVADMRRYLELNERGADAATEQKALFAAHQATLVCERERMQARIEYIASKVAYFDALEKGDVDGAQKIAHKNRLMVRALVAMKDNT